jgi:hypothetical protein
LQNEQLDLEDHGHDHEDDSYGEHGLFYSRPPRPASATTPPSAATVY